MSLYICVPMTNWPTRLSAALDIREDCVHLAQIFLELAEIQGLENVARFLVRQFAIRTALRRDRCW